MVLCSRLKKKRISMEEEDEEGEEEEDNLPGSTTAPDGIIPKTMVAGTSAKYVTEGNVSVYNHTGYTVDIPALLDNAPGLSSEEEGPKVAHLPLPRHRVLLHGGHRRVRAQRRPPHPRHG